MAEKPNLNVTLVQERASWCIKAVGGKVLAGESGNNPENFRGSMGYKPAEIS